MKKYFVILLFFFSYELKAASEVTMPTEPTVHNGYAQKSDNSFMYFEIKLNGNSILGANSSDIQYFIEAEYITNDMRPTYPFVMGYYQTIGNIDASGSSVNVAGLQSWVDVSAGVSVGISFDDFGGTQQVKTDFWTLKVTMKYLDHDTTIVYKPGGWGYDEVKLIDFKEALPSLNISVPNIAASICEGSISDVKTVATVSNADASGAYSIALADGGGASTFNPSYATVSGDTIKIASSCPAGNYTVKATVTDAASNTAETTFSFVVNANPSITISPNPGATICKGASLTLSITDAKSIANQYAWDAVGTSTDNNISSHNNLSAGNATYMAAPTGTMTYQAVAKSAAGCVDTTELLITVNEAPAATLTASSSTVCSGETITLTATTASGQTADSWKWVNPSSAVTANTMTVTPVNPGNAQISLTYRVKSVKGTCESAD